MFEIKNKINKIRAKRIKRIRAKLFGTKAKPRLSVFKSLRHIYVQAIIDETATTVAESSTLKKEFFQNSNGKLKKTEAAKKIGKIIANKLLKIGITKVIFDRGRFLYHGRIKALADAARENGLIF